MDKNELVNALKYMSDEEILALIRDARKEARPEHTGYERAEEFFYISVDGDLHRNTCMSEPLYDTANFYSDINVARECNRADTLMRKLRRFAAEHGGCIAPDGPKAWYITYYYPDESFEVKSAEYEDHVFTPGIVLFKSEKAAQDAINEFADELYWYFNFYRPMPDSYDCT